MGKKAQALLELALFLGLMLMVLLAALSYQRNLREQKLADENVFAQAKDRAYRNKFIETDIDGEEWECSGAIVSYSLNIDQQAKRIFQGGQRRTTGSSASIYYSNAEDPPNLDYNYYNSTDIGPEVTGNEALKKKIYADRPGGTEDPEDALKLNAADWISVLYPILSTAVTGIFNLEKLDWWTKWGGWLDLGLRVASFAYLAWRYADAIDNMAESDAESEALEDDDEQMSEWGWRVCDEVHDGEELAGKKYVKDVTAQIYDIATEENKNLDYSETQESGASTRSATVGQTVTRKILRRFDITSPDPTIALASHTFELIDEKDVTVDLGGVQRETW